jgi:hypothetical protein
LADLEDLNGPGDLVPGPHRRQEVPGDLQEHGARPWKPLGDHGVEDRAGHAALHDDLAEA